MRLFKTKTTGCVLVIGWQADQIATQLSEHSHAHMTHYIISGQAKRLVRATHLQHIDADLGDTDSIKTVFTQLAKRGHHPELVVFQAKPATVEQAQQSDAYSAAQLEQRWEQTGFSLFLWAQAAMTALQHPAKQRQLATFITLGSNLAIQPTASRAVDAALYAGMRAVMQSLAREFQPQGIHVAYVGLAADSGVEATATLCWQLHQQPRSAWTHEVELVGQSVN